MLSSEYLVHEINRSDIRHRKGWLPSEGIDRQVTGEHLKDELNELNDEVDKLLEVLALANVPLDDICASYAAYEAEVKQEMGDVFACLLQIMYRFSWTFEEINQEAVRKLRLRFIGADQIKIPGEISDTSSSTTSLCGDSQRVLFAGPDGERAIYTRGLPCS